MGLIFLLRRTRCFGVSEPPENWNSGEFFVAWIPTAAGNTKLWNFFWQKALSVMLGATAFCTIQNCQRLNLSLMYKNERSYSNDCFFRRY